MRNYIKKPAFTAPLLMLTVSILSVLSAVVMSKLSFKSSDELFLSYIITEILVFVLPGILYVKLKPRGYTADLNLISFGFSALPLILLTFCAMVFGGAETAASGGLFIRIYHRCVGQVGPVLF